MNIQFPSIIVLASLILSNLSNEPACARGSHFQQTGHSAYARPYNSFGTHGYFSGGAYRSYPGGFGRFHQPYAVYFGPQYGAYYQDAPLAVPTADDDSWTDASIDQPMVDAEHLPSATESLPSRTSVRSLQSALPAEQDIPDARHGSESSALNTVIEHVFNS